MRQGTEFLVRDREKFEIEVRNRERSYGTLAEISRDRTFCSMR